MHDIKILRDGQIIAGTDDGLSIIDTVLNEFKNYETSFKVKCILEHTQEA